MISAIDLFAGMGGWSNGARKTGVNILGAANHRLTMHMAGNAVPPLAGQRILEAVLEAA